MTIEFLQPAITPCQWQPCVRDADVIREDPFDRDGVLLVCIAHGRMLTADGYGDTNED